MPGNTLFNADIQYPDLSKFDTTAQKLTAIQNFLFLVLENLKYALRNLNPEDNFNQRDLDKWVKEIRAGTVISNTVITNELYSDYGAIADLTVWRLRTDYLRARNYLAEDTSQIDYIYIHDEEIELITAVTDGTEEEQLHIGDRYFWWRDANRTQMTSEENTGDPVMVYVYDELVKFKIAFQTVTMSSGAKTVAPVLTFGAGDGHGNAQGVMYKDLDDWVVKYTTAGGNVSQIRLDGSVHVSPSLTFGEEDASGNGTAVFEKNAEEDTMDMSYTNADGDSSAIRMGEYVDAKHRRPVRFDFSGLADGGSTFTVVWDGDDEEQTYIVERDTQGRIDRLIAPDFHETEVVWGGGSV